MICHVDHPERSKRRVTEFFGKTKNKIPSVRASKPSKSHPFSQPNLKSGIRSMVHLLVDKKM
jgi:hypothetical protein